MSIMDDSMAIIGYTTCDACKGEGKIPSGIACDFCLGKGLIPIDQVEVERPKKKPAVDKPA